MNAYALAQIEAAVRELPGHHRYCIDGTNHTGLPNRPLDVDEVAAHLNHPDTPRSVSDGIWRDLIDHTTGPDERWTLIAIRLALPGIRRSVARAHPILTTYPRADLETEAICAFTTALKTIDPRQTKLCSRLCQRVSSTLRTFLRDQLREIRTTGRLESESHPPVRPYGHVDLVLGDAVREGVIDQSESYLIGSVRIDGTELWEVAKERGVPRIDLNLKLKIAEDRLVKWILSDRLSEATGQKRIDSSMASKISQSVCHCHSGKFDQSAV